MGKKLNESMNLRGPLLKDRTLAPTVSWSTTCRCEQTTQMYSTSGWFSNTNSLHSALNGMYNVKQINIDKYQMIDDFQD